MIIAQKQQIKLKFELQGDIKITLIEPMNDALDSYIETLKQDAERFLKEQTYVPYPVMGFQNWLSENGWEIIKPFKIVDIDYPDDVVF
jgi:subtilisin-like proprotein convertase family protein